MHYTIDMGVDADQYFVADGVCKGGEGIRAAWGNVVVIYDGYHLAYFGLGCICNVYEQLVHADATNNRNL